MAPSSTPCRAPGKESERGPSLECAPSWTAPELRLPVLEIVRRSRDEDTRNGAAEEGIEVLPVSRHQMRGPRGDGRMQDGAVLAGKRKIGGSSTRGSTERTGTRVRSISSRSC